MSELYLGPVASKRACLALANACIERVGSESPAREVVSNPRLLTKILGYARPVSRLLIPYDEESASASRSGKAILVDVDDVTAGMRPDTLEVVAYVDNGYRTERRVMESPNGYRILISLTVDSFGPRFVFYANRSKEWAPLPCKIDFPIDRWTLPQLTIAGPYLCVLAGRGFLAHARVYNIGRNAIEHDRSAVPGLPFYNNRGSVAVGLDSLFSLIEDRRDHFALYSIHLPDGPWVKEFDLPSNAPDTVFADRPDVAKGCSWSCVTCPTARFIWLTLCVTFDTVGVGDLFRQCEESRRDADIAASYGSAEVRFTEYGPYSMRARYRYDVVEKKLERMREADACLHLSEGASVGPYTFFVNSRGGEVLVFDTERGTCKRVPIKVDGRVPYYLSTPIAL
ncbi:MAG: hypothetical protein WC483_00095 [Candidatus Paceibacterota bacterium]